MNKDYFLPISILIAGVLISVSVIYGTGLKNLGQPSGQKALKEESFSGEELNLTKDDVLLGELEAPVTLIEYSDFQCPFCGRFYSQTEPLIKENYVKTGKVKFVYRHFAFLGPESRGAAEAVECAKEQGKFWQYHDEIFNAEIADGRENNGNLNRGFFLAAAKKLGLDSSQFVSCLDGNKYSDKVENDYSVAQKIGVQATPTTFVNGQKLEGALPYAQFKAVIERELAK